MNWTVKNWFVGHDTDEWPDYDEDNVPFERIEKAYVPDEYSLGQIMNIFHGQLYSLYRDNRKFRLPLQLYFLMKISLFQALGSWGRAKASKKKTP